MIKKNLLILGLKIFMRSQNYIIAFVGTPKGIRRESVRPFTGYSGSINDQYDDIDFDIEDPADRVVQ